MNMSFQEISEEMGTSVNTALGRMRYGLMNLRKQKIKQQAINKKHGKEYIRRG